MCITIASFLHYVLATYTAHTLQLTHEYSSILLYGGSEVEKLCPGSVHNNLEFLLSAICTFHLAQPATHKRMVSWLRVENLSK